MMRVRIIWRMEMQISVYWKKLINMIKKNGCAQQYYTDWSQDKLLRQQLIGN